MKLTIENVNATFRSSLFTDEEVSNLSQEELLEKSVVVDGIRSKIGFNPDRIEELRDDITSMLGQFNKNFYSKDVGGEAGWSFLNMCKDKNGHLWTGMHNIMDKLIMLGLAIKGLKYCMPRDMWNVFPGEMPYIEILVDMENN